MHRLKAHELARLSDIEVQEVGEPPSVLYTAIHNARHGKPLTSKEKEKTAVRMTKAFPDFDLKDLAQKLAASRRSAERWTEETRSRTSLGRIPIASRIFVPKHMAV
jgi:hypothetical protein